MDTILYSISAKYYCIIARLITRNTATLYPYIVEYNNHLQVHRRLPTKINFKILNSEHIKFVILFFF